MLKTIIKRDGSEEPFLPSKINNWSIWASEQLGNRVDWSSVVMEAMQAFKEKASSQELQKQLIKICVRRANWAYSLMAGRLYAAMSRKEIYGSIEPPTIEEVHKNMAMVGLMRKLNYTSEEYQQIEKFIDHQRDFEMAYPQLLQLRKKYAIRNRVTKQEYESAQFVYMRMAMALAEDEPKDQRLNHIVNWYNHFSFNRINAPSPNYINLGTSLNGYASCCVFKGDDKLESLAIGDHIAYRMTGMSAGIGGIIDTRTLGDPVRGGAISHQGKLPYYRALGKATKANQQAGRGGAATSYYSAYDPENTTIAQLQNPLSTEDKRIRDIHFGVLYNAFFSKKVAKNEDVFLFTSYSAPDLWEAMFSGDVKEFERIYNEYDQSEYIEKKYINARDFVVLARQQAYETGTHYEAFIDEMNRHTPFKDPIYSSNLCNEISLPTGGYQSMMDLYNSNDHGKITIRNVDAEDVTVAYADQIFVDIDGTFVKKWVGDLRKGMSYRLHESAPIRTVHSLKKNPGGEIAICALAGLVLTNIHSEQQYQSAAYYALKMIDKCIDMSDYPFEHVAMTAKARRSAGVGLLGLATDMARKKLSYSSQEGRDYCHKVAERHYYWLLEASLQLAKEKGNAAWMHRTKWPEGWLPIDTYKKQVDQIAKPVYHYDWEDLRARIKEQGGIRNSVIAALMPTESCLSWNTEIQTEQGSLSMLEYFQKTTGKTLEHANSQWEGLISGDWYDVINPIKVNTRFGYKEVKRVYYTGLVDVLTITMEDGKQVRCTPHHKFFVNTSWRLAKDLEIGEKLYKNCGTICKISNIEITGQEHCFEIEVEDVHEYLLDDGLVVHNSAKASGVPNSIYPIRELSIKKSDNTNVIDWVATDSDLLKDDYEIAWDIPTMDMIKIYAIFQKFTDQGISADFWRDRSTDPIVYTDEIVEEHLAMCKYGMKGRYYQNSLTTDQDDIKNTEAMAKAAIDNIVQSVQQSSKAVDDEDELADSDRGCAGGACSL